MATTSFVRTESQSLPQPRMATKPFGPLLVATDASLESDAALLAAAEISARTRRPVKLLAVHAPMPIVAPEIQIPMSPGMEAEARATLSAQVREQVARVGVGDQWSLETVSGDPAAMIASISHSVDASLIIMGLGGHGLFDRLLGDETVLKVVRLGSGAVLAVAPGFSGVPERILAAVDFSASSGHALMLGTELVRAKGCITMAHVVPRDTDWANWTSPNAAYSGTVGRAFDRMVAEIGCGESLRIQRRVLGGDPAKALLGFAKTMSADLIVTGTHGHDFLTRLRVGSVSTKVLRDAHCSILIAPHEDAPGYIEELAEERGRFAFYEWAERLEEFTRRNAGRHALLEVIDPDRGAEVQQRGVRFVGATFDHHDARIHLMFENDERQHFTRSVNGVTGVQMLRDRSGHDLFLRIAHGRLQTLLTLERV